MRVRIVDDEEKTIWERGKECGVACQSYCQDGTQQTIIEILTEALEQARGELAHLDESNGVPDIGTSAT